MERQMKLNTKLLTSTALVSAMLIFPVANAKTFKMALGDAEGSAQYELGSKFSEVFAEKTGGKHKIAMFPNGQLGSEQDTVNEAAIGTLDFSLLAINNVTPFAPKTGLLTLPYMIQSLDDAVKLTRGEVGKELTESTIQDAGIRIVGWSYTGFRVLTNSKKPVTKLEDLQGLVIRVPKNEIMLATYKAWGINATPMAWSETFTALQQGVVDGQDNPYLTISSMKFNEVQKYVTNIRYLFSLEPLVVSESVFQDLDEDVQTAILEAGEAATLHSEQFLKDTEDRIKKELVEKGMEISDPDGGEAEWIEKATSEVWPAYYESVGGKERVDAVLKLLGR
jgi:tripartite ATP-independent transporter DctP family solute receptor